MIYRCPRCNKVIEDREIDEKTKPVSVKCSGCKLRTPVHIIVTKHAEVA